MQRKTFRGLFFWIHHKLAIHPSLHQIDWGLNCQRIASWTASPVRRQRSLHLQRLRKWCLDSYNYRVCWTQRHYLWNLYDTSGEMEILHCYLPFSCSILRMARSEWCCSVDEPCLWRLLHMPRTETRRDRSLNRLHMCTIFFSVEVLNMLNRPLLGRLIKANRFFFQWNFLWLWDLLGCMPFSEKNVKENSFRDGIQHSWSLQTPWEGLVSRHIIYGMVGGYPDSCWLDKDDDE